MIIQFPRPRRGRHTAASAKAPAAGRALAAKAASVSAVKPAVVALSVAKIAAHHSSGMRLRCRHLVTIGTEAPMSEAISSLVDQRSTMDWKDIKTVVASDMPSPLGQIVLKSKTNVSGDCEYPGRDTTGMGTDQTATIFKQAFIARTKAAREARYTQAEIAALLEVPQDRYKQYETRSLLPHHLIPRFCLACGIAMPDLFNSVIPKVAKIPVRKGRRRAA